MDTFCDASLFIGQRSALHLAVQITWRGRALLLAASALMATASQVAGQQAAEPKPVNHLHQVGRIRVFYHTEGKHAVDPTDSNHNGVPDQVEDVATQTKAAWLLFVDALGFRDPFSTERYRTAAFLDIGFRHKDVLRTNGAAYDELQRFKRAGDPADTVSLCFNVATSVQAHVNLTPAHEFFHVLQNSVTYFKNRWYTEGMARWSERALGLGAFGLISENAFWPLSTEKHEALFAMTYDASEHFWNPIAVSDDPEGSLDEAKLSAELKQLAYVNGTRVMKDFRFAGWKLMREVLRELDKADDLALRELGHDRWSEENQKSKKNDPFILRAVMKAIEARKTASVP